MSSPDRRAAAEKVRLGYAAYTPPAVGSAPTQPQGSAAGAQLQKQRRSRGQAQAAMDAPRMNGVLADPRSAVQVRSPTMLHHYVWHCCDQSDHLPTRLHIAISCTAACTVVIFERQERCACNHRWRLGNAVMQLPPRTPTACQGSVPPAAAASRLLTPQHHRVMAYLSVAVPSAPRVCLTSSPSAAHHVSGTEACRKLLDVKPSIQTSSMSVG